MEEAEQVGKIDPKPAIQTAGIEPPIHQCIVTLDHHEAFTSQAVHHCACLQTLCLSESIHHQCQTSCQQSSAENRGAKREVRAGPTAGRGSVEQVSYAPLYHQYGEGEQCADSKPPSKGSHWCPRNRAHIGLEIAPIGHCSRGSTGCQEDRLLIHSTYRQTSYAPHGEAATGADAAFNPRWRKMETLPLPLSAVTSPGSSASFVVTRNVASAKGPGFVR